MTLNPLSLISWLIGRGGSPAFADTLNSSIDRANVRFIVPDDSRLYIRRWTRKNLIDKAEWLWQNFGIVKEGVAGIARHTVGKGINLQIDSDDDEWNQLAEDDFESYALTKERCDLAGRRTFYQAQEHAISQRILRGEFFAAKTENPDWGNEPCFQIYDTEEIISPPNPPANSYVVDAPSLAIAAVAPGSAPSQDSIIFDGVELNRNSRAVGYWVRTVGFEAARVPRERMIHWMKPHATNQVRGITELAQAVNCLVDIHELKRLTTRTAKAQQLIALVLKGVGKSKARGAIGAIRNAGVKDDGTPNPDTAQLEQLAGGAGAGIAYLDSDGDAKMISPNSPTPLVEGFITDLLMRDATSALGVMSDFLWNPKNLGGSQMRFVLSKTDLLFQILGSDLIGEFCTPIAFNYLLNRIATGKLRPPTDKNWMLKLSWQTPPRVTVDNGNEGNLQIELLANGLITLRQYCNARGLNYRHEMRQWIREPIEFIKMAAQELKDSSLDPEQQQAILERWSMNLPLWRPNKPGAVAPPQENEQPSKDGGNDKEQQAA